MYFELEMNETMYKFKFGVGFMNEMNKKLKVPVEGVKGAEREVGMNYAIASVIDGDIPALIDVLFVANKGFEPRLKMSVLEAYIEDERTDLDELFIKVIDFFKSANVSKRATIQLLAVADQEAQALQMQKN